MENTDEKYILHNTVSQKGRTSKQRDIARTNCGRGFTPFTMWILFSCRFARLFASSSSCVLSACPQTKNLKASPPALKSGTVDTFQVCPEIQFISLWRGAQPSTPAWYIRGTHALFATYVSRELHVATNRAYSRLYARLARGFVSLRLPIRPRHKLRRILINESDIVSSI